MSDVDLDALEALARRAYPHARLLDPTETLALIIRLRAAEDALVNARRFDAAHVCERVIREAEGRGHREGLRAAEARTAWQPIATAPMGEWVLMPGTEARPPLAVRYQLASGQWLDTWGHVHRPTHWMPLPAAPEAP